MKEDFLQYIWKQELFDKTLTSVTGELIEVLLPGTQNTDAGPDFLNARIKIDNTIWAGNVEIHTDSANWDRHNHQNDAAYNNVILHIVSKYSKEAIRQNGDTVPTAILVFNEELFSQYNKLVASKEKIRCHNDISSVDSFTINMWLNTLSIERLENKTDYIKDNLNQTNNNWEEAFYIILARNFGFKTNALPFELLAKSIPLKLLAKYNSNLLQLEALLFGQAGFLNEQIEDIYYNKLRAEYDFLRKAHKLTPLDNYLWKFLRLRPTNFPTIRIAQFAKLVFKSKHLFSKTIEANTIDELMLLYECGVSEYWENHYNFLKSSKKTKKEFGKSALYGIFINTVIPFLFIYGKLRLKPELMDKAIDLLNRIPFEKNSIITNWNNNGIKPVSAAQSQALIQLTNNYCNPKNCLYCQIGNTIIRNKN